MADDFDHPEATWNIVGGMQRHEQINQLNKLTGEIERQRSLPDCPHCGNKIPKRGVDLCGSCRREVAWVQGVVCKNTRTAIAELTRQLETAEKRRKAEVADRRKSEAEEEAKQNRDYITSRSAWEHTQQCIFSILGDAAYICFSLYLWNATQDLGKPEAQGVLVFGLAIGFPIAKFLLLSIVGVVLAIVLIPIWYVLPSKTDDTAIEHSLTGLEGAELKKIASDLRANDIGCLMYFCFCVPIYSLILLPFCISSGFKTKKILEKYGLDLKSGNDKAKNTDQQKAPTASVRRQARKQGHSRGANTKWFTCPKCGSRMKAKNKTRHENRCDANQQTQSRTEPKNIVNDDGSMSFSD